MDTKPDSQNNRRNTPARILMRKGIQVAWCTCGESQKQPFCDGTHRNTSLKPLKFTPNEDSEVLLCMCKQTKNPPYCDGTHTSISPQV